jgi:uncharacterized NAD-dependent epimerase/dehydratase family protein
MKCQICNQEVTLPHSHTGVAYYKDPEIEKIENDFIVHHKDLPCFSDAVAKFSMIREAKEAGYDEGRHEAVMQFEKHQKEAESRGREAGVKETEEKFYKLIDRINEVNKKEVDLEHRIGVKEERAKIRVLLDKRRDCCVGCMYVAEELIKLI